MTRSEGVAQAHHAPHSLSFRPLVIVAALGGCGHAAGRSPGIASGPGPVVLHDGTGASCIPGPLEECGNARDDNCNGAIDEGCGQRTGLVQFVIAWNAPNADVDLLVTDPKGELVEVGHPSAAGLVKDRDCPGRKRECHGRNTENVFLDKGEEKRGRYRVRIRLERLNDEDTPIRVTFGARVGPRSYAAEIDLEQPESERELVFEL